MTEQKLFRSQNERIIGGVCGGLAPYLKVDVTLIRLAFVLLFILGGHGLLLYLVLWIIMPVDPHPDIIERPSVSQSSVNENQ